MHPRFRAAYDLLLLRAQSGEPLNDLVEYWTKEQLQEPQMGKSKIKTRQKRNNSNRNNKNSKKINIDELSSKNILKPKSSLPDKSNEAKPLQHVNISDLLTAHKKGGRDA